MVKKVAKKDPSTPTGPEKPPRRLVQAAREDINLIAAASFTAASFAFLSPIPFGVGLVLEGIYLLAVPKSRWFEERLDARYEREVFEKREQLKSSLFPALSDDVRNRFGRLEKARGQIRVEPGDQSRWYRAILRKLDYLMEKFLLFSKKDVQFRDYLISVREEASELNSGTQGHPKPARRFETRKEIESDGWTKISVGEVQAAYDQETAALDGLISQDENPHNQSILQKRKEILLRRRIYVGRIGEILTNLNHQVKLIEDTFGLINDEIRARSPEQVLADIDDVIDSTDVLTEALQKVAPFEEMHVEA